jgi:hypothetical protein
VPEKIYNSASGVSVASESTIHEMANKFQIMESDRKHYVIFLRVWGGHFKHLL